MTLLLDTHAFLWFCQDDPLLSTTAKALIEDASNRKLLSVASCWEIAIKAGLRKLRLGEPSAAYYHGNQDPHKSLQPIRSTNSRSRLPRNQRSTTESTEIHGKENPNQLPLSVSFQGATPARRVGSFRGYPFVMIFLAGVITP